VRREARLPYALLRDLLGGKLNLYAMSLVYATLLALIPLVAFSFAVMKLMGVHHIIRPLVFEFFRPMGDAAGTFTERVMLFADRVRGGLVGGVGLVLLVWTLIGTVKRLEDSFNFVWRVDVARSFGRRLTEYLALLLLGPVLIGAVTLLSRLAADSAPLRALAALPSLERLYAVWLVVGPCVIASACMTVLYIFLPNTRVRLKPALVGGIAAGVLWALVGRAFAVLVLYSARLTLIYAGFAIVVAALVWTYLGWMIFLLGAQVSFYVQNPGYMRLGLRELRLSNADTERLALSIMYLVGKSHQEGALRYDVAALSAELNFPGAAVARLCDALKEAGLLIATGSDLLVPGRDCAQIRLIDIIAVARHRSEGQVQLGHGTPAAVQALFDQLEAAWRDSCAHHTLSDLLDYSPPIVMPSISSEPVRIAP
jgi:membrane protein